MKLPRLPHQGARSRELDFIRGIAILLVMGVHFDSIPNTNWFYHAFEFPGKSFGGSGVDLFFVLSGFLVGGLLLKEYKNTGTLRVSAFIFRRGFKIWPAYYFFLLLQVLSHSHPLKSFLWQNVFHVQNYVGSSITHTWTLSLEEHFYLLLALSMGWMTSRKWPIEKILKVFIGTMVLVFFVRCGTVALGFHGANEMTHTRIDSLLMGVVLASLFHFYPEKFEALSKKPLPLIGITAAVVAFMVFVQDQAIRFSIGFTIIYFGAAALTLLVFSHSGKIKENAIYKFIAMIGVYSYAIYLYHNSVRGPAMKIAMHAPEVLRWPALMILQYGLAILLGMFTTQLIEWPFLRIRNKVIPQQVQDIGTPDEEEKETETVKKAKRWPLYLAISFCVLIAVGEVAARKIGLGNPPLYIHDSESMYALKPSQHLKRFGRNIHINQWGMRSEDLADVPAVGKARVLFVGDSVTWGGAQTDQKQTFPYLVADKVANLETLNPSCGGWAPANELGWLTEHGIYASNVVVLVYNDGDLFQSKAPDIAGKHSGYPDHKPTLAIQEGVMRYLLKVNQNDPGTGQDAPSMAVAAEIRKTIQAEIDLVKKAGAKVIVYESKLDPIAKLPDHTIEARAELKKMVEGEGIPYLTADLDHADYYNAYHPNPKGNEAIASLIAPMVKKLLSSGKAH